MFHYQLTMVAFEKYKLRALETSRILRLLALSVESLWKSFAQNTQDLSRLRFCTLD